MAFTPYSLVRDVHGINEEQKTRIRDVLQGAVYCWCKNRPDEWFSMRDLMGGENYYWEGTPLIALYEKHHEEDDAVERAGKDSGWLLKRVRKDVLDYLLGPGGRQKTVVKRKLTLPDLLPEDLNEPRTLFGAKRTARRRSEEKLEAVEVA